MITSIEVKSVYEEKDGKISVHVAIKDASGTSLRDVGVQVDRMDDLKEALRKYAVAEEDKAEKRLTLVADAERVVAELQTELTAAKEADSGTNLDR